MIAIADTLAYVRTLHDGHFDRLGRPYSQHLERVLAHLVRLFPDAGDPTRQAALLHGSVEERKVTFEALAAQGYSDEIIEMVRWNTRPRGEGAPAYLDWIRDLAEHAPLGAVRIKIADNEDNNDPRRIAQLPPAERDVSEAYSRARAILTEVLARRLRSIGD